MPSLIRELESITYAALQAAYPTLPPRSIVAAITPTARGELGHYQCNNPLKLAKQLQQPPGAIAKTLQQHFLRIARQQGIDLADLQVAGPGFLNITLSTPFLNQRLQQQLNDPYLGVTRTTAPQRIVVEFSSPNIAKELHVGHLRSTILGDCLARLFTFLGHDVLRLNHFGDWGTQFGILLAYFAVEGIDPSQEPLAIDNLMECYRQGQARFASDAAFKKEAQRQVIALQQGDPHALAIWRSVCTTSCSAYQRIYALLDIEALGRGESFYNDLLPQIVAKLERQQLVTLSEQAKCIFLSGFPIPLIVQKADGGYNYATTDLAAMWQRIIHERADRIIIVTDAGQRLHFQMVTQVLEKAKILNTQRVRFDHVVFGVVHDAQKKKFKTRSGKTERLLDLLLEGIARARQILEQRLPLEPAATLDRSAQILGINAIKYADLSYHRLRDYTFDYQQMLRFEGNTAPFLLYAYVRIEGIKRHVGKELPLTAKIALRHASEIALGLQLLRFPEVIDKLAADLLPHRLSDYLYALATKFHAFFRDCPVAGSGQESSRLLLCELTARVLATGMELLGLKVLPRM